MSTQRGSLQIPTDVVVLHPMFGSVKLHVSKAATESFVNNAAVNGHPISAPKLEALLLADRAPASLRPALQTTRQDGMDIRICVFVSILNHLESS